MVGGILSPDEGLWRMLGDKNLESEMGKGVGRQGFQSQLLSGVK